MPRRTIGWLLITLMAIGAFPVSAAEPTVKEQVSRLRAGRRIHVELNSGERLKGRMGSTTADRFTVEPASPASGTARVLRIDETRSVKPDGLTTGQKWAIFGLVWIAVGIIAKVTV